MSIRTRFAPSPTGFVHVGSLRAALFPYLFARKMGGTFILRIEDTDQERLVEGSIENLLRVLEWTGMTPDEGPRFDKKGSIEQVGEFGPYIQSERLAVYKKYAGELIDKGFAYYAFDTGAELEAMRERQTASKLPPKYERMAMRNQLTLGIEETKKLLDSGAEAVIRLKVPDDKEIVFEDMIRGKVTVHSSTIDDQVLLKSDGFPTYHLAVIVDDHTMQITHVIRGEDWLPSTPKHILLYEAFGWEHPWFAHLPLLVNEEKQKLSKRKGDVAVEDFKEKGYLPEALINFIAFLGWNPGDNRELFTLDELVQEFSLERVQKASAVFNREKLNWYNQAYIRKLEAGELVDRCLPYLVKAGLINEAKIEAGMIDWLAGAVGLVQERLVTLADAPSMMAFLFAQTLEYEPELLVWKKSTKEDAKNTLEALIGVLEVMTKDDWTKNVLEEKIGGWISSEHFGVGDVLWPMRVALSGQKNSPGPYEIAAVLGKEKTLTRIQEAARKL